MHNKTKNKEIKKFRFKNFDKKELIHILYNTGLTHGLSGARRLVVAGVIKVNGDKIKDYKYILNSKDFNENLECVIKKGRKKRLITIEK